MVFNFLLRISETGISEKTGYLKHFQDDDASAVYITIMNISVNAKG